MKTILSKKFLPIGLIILVIPTFFSMIRPGYFFMQDDLQAFRIFEMNKCFQDHQIPCRWVPDPGYQYGYPQFEYYPPSVYYLGELIHLIGFQFIDSVKILFALGYILSALAMYLLLQELLGEWPAFFGALLYTYTPYKAVEVYVRGAMSEFWSFVFFPIIFWSSLRLIRDGRKKYLALLGLSVGGLLITHNLMSMIFLPIAGVWSLLWLYLEKKWSLFWKVAAGFLLGLGLAAFFTLPVLTEQKYAHIESLVGGYFGYEQHFVPLNLLFLSNRWGYGSSGLGQKEILSLSTGIIQWVAAVITFALIIFCFKKNRKISSVVMILSVIELGVLFMMHERSMPIWKLITPLKYLQFPWRFLSDSVFLLGVLVAAGIFLIKKKWQIIYGSVLVIAVLILHVTFFQPRTWYNITDQDKFSGTLWEKELTISIFDYLPIYATLPPIKRAPDDPEILNGSGQVISYQKGSDFQTGQIRIEKASEIRLPLFDFPGMRVWVDGKEVYHWNNDCRLQPFCLGLISFHLDPGIYVIKAELTNTPIRWLGNGLTLISLGLVTWLLLPKRHENFS